MDEILYGVVYYYEYLFIDCLLEDVVMMKDCGINVVCIGELIWVYQELQDGVFKMDYFICIFDMLYVYGLKVIIGMFIYVIFFWLVKKYFDILFINKNG